MNSLPRDAALAMSPERFAALGHALVDRLAAELAGLPQRPIAREATPAQLRALLGAARGLPASGADAGALLDEAANLLFEHSVLSAHPRFHAYIAAPPAPIGVLAELLAAALNANVAAWHAAPLAAEIEAQTLRWLAELVGYPSSSGGLLTSGGSAGNAIALQLALHAALPRYREEGLNGARLAVYASDQTHAWLPKTIEQCGLGRAALRWIASDAHQRLPIDTLARAIEADRAAGVRPLLAVGSAGTTATGAVDPLAAMAALCRAHGLWFHVDGAYGAPAACLLGTADEALLGSQHEAAPGSSDEARPRGTSHASWPHSPSATGDGHDIARDLAAMCEADSLALDPHKWLYAPLEAGGVLVREGWRLQHAFGSERPGYYQDSAATFAAAGTDFHRLGPQNTRGFRALKVWLALRMAGRDGYRRMIAGDIALARHLHARVSATAHLQAIGQSLGVCTFRYRPPVLRDDEASLNELNRELLHRLQRDGRAWLSPAQIEGRFLLRACIVNFNTQQADIDTLPALVAELGDALMRE